MVLGVPIFCNFSSCFTPEAGKNFPATLAESHGLISRIVPDAADASTKGSGVVAEALSVAEEIAAKGRLAVIAAKEAVNVSQDVGLTQGLAYERRLFQSLFATADQKEGKSLISGRFFLFLFFFFDLFFLSLSLTFSLPMTGLESSVLTHFVTNWVVLLYSTHILYMFSYRYGGVCKQEESRVHEPIKMREL